MEDWKNTQCRACKTGTYLDFGEGDGPQGIVECSFCDARVRRYGDSLDGKIKRNAAQCRKCHEVIESTHRHDFVRCSCGAIAVDGGKAYLRRVGNFSDCIELSEFVEELEDDSNVT